MLQFGRIDPSAPVLIRMHSSCCFGDVFHGLSCDCRAQLETSVKRIVQEGSGIIFYLNQEGRGVGLSAKIEAISLEQRNNIDTVEAFSQLHYPLDQRKYDAVSKLLLELQINSVRLLTNNPSKISALESKGILVTREPLVTAATKYSAKYLRTKIQKMGHIWTPRSELPKSDQLKKAPQ